MFNCKRANPTLFYAQAEQNNYLVGHSLAVCADGEGITAGAEPVHRNMLLAINGDYQFTFLPTASRVPREVVNSPLRVVPSSLPLNSIGTSLPLKFIVTLKAT